MSQPPPVALINIAFAIVVAAMIGILGIAIFSLPSEAVGLSGAVEAELDQAGAKNPVTAVLLNFRGYDTMLEIVVLLLAVIGTRVLTTADASLEVERNRSVNPVLLGFIRILAPVMIVVAGYLLWVGGHAPGGAFQAAAVLAAMGVLLKLGGVPWTRNLSQRGERLLLVAGLAVFLVVATAVMLTSQRNLLQYPPSAAKTLILLIESAAAVSIAAILLALFGSGTLRETQSPVPRDEIPRDEAAP
ncbi:putative monovalent cation/H+ antiporter subunit B [Novipirellula galeiformis]|uniref:Putative monovalent cation/H+ antiporter subunit B n=1 Tax=Novipirellula galeiformis TaxID=2528004 RepID=A0A5C6CH06_9BACT|nr:MnhB domain-containing protein [Novipirellula galeiformis]TWU22516.1 putative monovalent cation/H+ antiporter subunit B [Novipirellula galeiformis]